MNGGAGSSTDPPGVVSPEVEVVEEADEEGQEPRVPAYGCRPTLVEVEFATHIPYREWCPFCVAGKFKNKAHRKMEPERVSDVPVVSMDYMFLTQGASGPGQSTLVQGQDEEEVGEDPHEKHKKGMPVLVTRCRRTKFITAGPGPDPSHGLSSFGVEGGPGTGPADPADHGTSTVETGVDGRIFPCWRVTE